MSDVDERIDDLFERASETVAKIRSSEDEGDLGAVASYLDDLEDVADEAEDILEHVDLADLVSAIDWSELPEAVDIEDVPDAVEEGDPTEAIALRKLLAIADLSEVWESTDAREAWREKRELEAEVDDLTDDEDDDERFGDDGIVDDDLGNDVSMPDTDIHEVDPESIENAIQSQVSDSVATFREKLIDAHHRFGEIREENAARFPDRKRNRTRNPTAMTTLPKDTSPSGRGMRHSTVPVETRHSTAPNRKRIYGTRFDRAGGDGDE